ncbi:sensor histidine kinase [Aequorivita capsosiphonis]|uniref:sensor histidine kinase n=1 Tax=Aequorivita capsosiphonis TaxID=487317 RepID=UPI00040A701B|nr:histidine kinase [Aequorivita capsosiphonis]
MVITGTVPLEDFPVVNEFLVDKFRRIFFYALTFIPFQIFATYLIAYIIIPKFILKKKYLWGATIIIISAYILSVTLRITMVHLTEPLIRTPPFSKESITEILINVPFLFFKYTIRLYQIVFIFLLIKYFLDYKKQKEENLLLDKAKIETELKMLKMQLNPHFLFNTLNNIYSLALIKSDQAPIALEKLSKILDYIIYDGEKKYIPLKKEIDLIENFIELKELSYPSLKVTFEKNVSQNLQVVPLLLLSLVENAFKHSATKKGTISTVGIELKSSGSKILFNIWNTKGSDLKIKKSELGNKNLIKQLSLTYGSNSEIEFEDMCDLYRVKLTIDTNL